MHALTAKVSAKKSTTKTCVKPPHASPTPGRKMSYGAVVVDEAHARVLLREPTNHWDNYVWTFAKGRLDPGETPEVCALREVREELGITARIIGQVPGIFAGGTGDNEYFIAEYEADAGQPDNETHQVRWVTWDEAPALIKLTTNHKGQKRDLEVLALARKGLKK